LKHNQVLTLDQDEADSTTIEAFIKLSPVDASGKHYLHDCFIKFYIEEEIMAEINESKGNSLDPNSSVLGVAFLSREGDILRSIGQHIMNLRVGWKGDVVFPCLVKSVQLSRERDDLSA
jgi:hypothetical protein